MVTIAERSIDAGVDIRLARRDDDADLRRLLRDNPIGGAISVSLEREPSVFLAAAVEGDDHRIIVARDRLTGAAVGMASRVVYSGFVNGAPRRIGYLAQLRIDRGYRGRLGLLRHGYGLLRSIGAPSEAGFDLTAIVSDNAPARRLLEAGLPGLPTYRRVASLTTLIVPTQRPSASSGSPAPAGVSVVGGSADAIPEVADCLARNGRRYQFARAWQAGDLTSTERSRGLAPDDFVMAVEGSRVIGCAALWDQRSFKQIVVRRYAPRVSRAKRWLDLGARLLPLPTLPDVHRPLAYAHLSHVAIDGDRRDVFGALFSVLYARACARGFACLIAGFADGHAFLDEMRRHRRSWSYASTLYAVHWGDPREPLSLDLRMPHVEVALL